MEVKHIQVVTNYWLFKKTYENSDYYFVRVQGQNPYSSVPNWFMGYLTHMGTVARIGGDLSIDTIDVLENEFRQWAIDRQANATFDTDQVDAEQAKSEYEIKEWAKITNRID